MTDIILKNLELLDPAIGELKSGYEILISGGEIKKVVKGKIKSRKATVYDLSSCTLMPGLIDCHVHVTSVKLKWAMNSLQQILPSYATAITLDKLRRCVLRGFTTVRDTAGADVGHREIMRSGLFPGPRLFVSGRAISQTGGHADMRSRIDHSDPCNCFHMIGSLSGGMGRIADGIAEVRRAVRDEIRLGVDQIKVMASGGVGSPADPIHFLQYSMEELSAIVEEAERADTYAMAHAYTSAAIFRAVKAGVRTIEHGNFIDEKTANFMVEKNAYLVPTLVAYYMISKHGKELGYPEESIAKNKNVLKIGTNSLKVAKEAGVKIAFGTDLMGELDIYQSDEFIIRSKILTNAEIIRSATVVGAEVLRMEGRLGIITPGAFADLIVVEGNPLEDLNLLTGQGKYLAAIMKEGQFLKNNFK